MKNLNDKNNKVTGGTDDGIDNYIGTYYCTNPECPLFEGKQQFGSEVCPICEQKATKYPL